MEMFTPDYPRTHTKFLALKDNGFVSEQTRVIFLEFTIYNFNLGLLVDFRSKLMRLEPQTMGS